MTMFRLPRRRPRRRLASIALLLLSAVLLAIAPARADHRVVPGSDVEARLSFAPLVREVVPAVVNIYTRTVVAGPVSPFFEDPLFRRFFGDAFPAPQGDRIQNSLGSGVIVDASGLIVTNHHVIAGADEITVVLADRTEYDAEIVQDDERTDLAVLRIETEGRELPALELGDPDDLQVGDLVLAVGNPFGVGQTVTSGIVSALARTSIGVSDFRSFIQTDAPINPGNSGGALVDMHGRLAGVNTAIYSRSGGSVGIGFAVPSVMVATVLNAARGGSLVRPWLGASGQDMTSGLADSMGMDRPRGVLISEIVADGPADRGGLRVGDVVVAIGGREIVDGQELRFRIATRQAGGTATLTVLRDGDERDLVVPLEAPPEDPPRDLTLLEGRNPLAGATVGNLSPAFADEIGAGTGLRGVIITSIGRGTPAHRFRVAPGDIVRTINGEDIDSVDELERMLRDGAREWRVVLERNGQPVRIAVRG